MGKKSIFSRNDYEKLKRTNDKRLKYFDMKDRNLMKDLLVELDVRGAARAYIEVVRTDLINAMIAEEKSRRSVKRDLLGILGGDFDRAVEDIMEAAPQRPEKQKTIMALGDAFFTYIFLLALVAGVSSRGYNFVFGPGILALLAVSFVALFFITRSSGRNAKTEEGRRRSGGPYKLAVLVVTSLAAAAAHMILHLPEPWHVNGWVPVLLAILCWLSCYNWDSKINDDTLTQIQRDYTA